MEAKEFRAKLLEISRHITPHELEEVKYLCTDFLPECLLEKATALSLFRGLEKQGRLGIDRLDCLMYILEKVNRRDLTVMLKDFQRLREEYLLELHGENVTDSLINQRQFNQFYNSNNVADFVDPTTRDNLTPSSGSPASNKRESGEISLRCVFEMASVGAWLGGCAFILNRYRNDPVALASLMATVVLPSGFLVKYVTEGSVKFVLWTAELDALKELWNRYKTGQLRRDLEKVLVTEGLRSIANGEEIEFTVEIDIDEYRNTCLDLMVAYNKATRLIATSPPRNLRRAISVEDMTSTSIRPITERSYIPELSRDVHLSQYRMKHLSQLTKDSSTSSGFSGSVCSEADSGHGHILLSDFLNKSNRLQDIVSGILDREMILCHDWRSLASKCGYKMNDIRLLERRESPTLALLEDIAFSRSPDTKLSELIDKLSDLERDDVVDQILGCQENNDPRALVNLPFEVRKKFALELDHATLAQFTDVVHNIASSISPSEITSFQKRPSPTMSLLEELETAFPDLDICHLQRACKIRRVDGAAAVLQEYAHTKFKCEKAKGKSAPARRKESLQRLRQVGGDSGVEMLQSPTEEVSRPFPS